MDLFGNIQTFNPLTGTGFIRPAQGGAMIPFNQIELKRPRDAEVREGSRVHYKTEEDDLGELVAVQMHLA
ncbi:hypothetical protein [Qipengyuania sphaerica]|uniref:hypothetical protein n=1 Tax=Qipengyuania sphaerica TaxID=2867243 RepID=UPI001C877363|nr:hypothetical protein [Qipengyuania sphaerica]MBX7539576.1 hypothetical protein [Qipengyuania sphaerica]